MALIHCNFFSNVLGVQSAMDVILPQPPAGPKGLPLPAAEKHPTLYLLHGLSDDHTMWQRRTSIERYVDQYDLAVVMPAVGRSFYTDMAAGYPYWTFISEELPAIAAALFPLDTDREHTFVAGLSMGGYGAFKLALTHPERYSAAASFSGALNMAIVEEARPDPAWLTEMRWIYGDLKQLPNSPNDLFHLAGELKASGKPQPMLYQWCGTEDFLYVDNLRFRDHLQKIGLELNYEEGPGGHEWTQWDKQIEHFLTMLPLTKL